MATAEKTFLNTPIDADLKRALKSECALRGQTLTQFVDQILREQFVKKHPRVHVVGPELLDGK